MGLQTQSLFVKKQTVFASWASRWSTWTPEPSCRSKHGSQASPLRAKMNPRPPKKCQEATNTASKNDLEIILHDLWFILGFSGGWFLEAWRPIDSILMKSSRTLLSNFPYSCFLFFSNLHFSREICKSTMKKEFTSSLLFDKTNAIMNHLHLLT